MCLYVRGTRDDAHLLNGLSVLLLFNIIENRLNWVLNKRVLSYKFYRAFTKYMLVRTT